MIVKPFWDAKSYQLFFNVVLLLHLVNIVWFCTTWDDITVSDNSDMCLGVIIINQPGGG